MFATHKRSHRTVVARRQQEDAQMTKYATIKLPRDLTKQIDEVVERQDLCYASRAELVKDAVRGFLAKIKRAENDST